MIEWKRSKPQYNESVQAITFNENMPEIAKQLQDEKGNWVNGKTHSDGQWTYRAKSWTNKEGTTTLWFVERYTPKPSSGQRMSKEEWEQKDKERNARIDKAHQENLEVEKAKVQELKNLNETLAAILQELRVRKEE